jgi:hypothetical protein
VRSARPQEAQSWWDWALSLRAFIRLRQLLAANDELGRKLEELERKLQTHDRAIVAILAPIRELKNPQLAAKRPIGFTADLERKARVFTAAPSPQSAPH